jgi:exodeoxyribonuclease V alpha subunit
MTGSDTMTTKTAPTRTASAVTAPTLPDGRLPGDAPRDLAAYVAAGVIGLEDIGTVAMLVEMARHDSPAVELSLRAWIALCLAVRSPQDGHTCVDLAAVGDSCGEIELSAEHFPGWTTDVEDWIAALAAAKPLVDEPKRRAPFQLDHGPAGTRLYPARSLHEEEEIARRLGGPEAARVEILLGGPGTGKTTTVATRLITLMRDDPDRQIYLAAPTGKAAARMQEALKARLHDEHAPEEIRTAPQEVRNKVEGVRPVTIHKLLGYRPHGTPRYRFHAGNKLEGGLVVIDEASMLSSAMMHHLLAAIGGDTRLLLVGDPNQLASVDAGSVLGDIAKAADREGSPLAARTTTLRIRHRFGPRIGALADAILAADGAGVARAFEILDRRWDPPPDPANTMPDDPESIRLIEPGSADLKTVVAEVAEHAALLRSLAQEGKDAEALAARKALQVLCAHRAGAAGVAGWNARVEKQLGVGGWNPWYAGRPIMVTRNNPALDLFNGDVGIVVRGDADGPRHVAFPRAQGEPRRVAVSQLEDVDTVHALTVHKSQGSEYEHVVVVLPERASRILTKELLYTAVTRASKRVTVVGSRAVIEAAIRRPIRRATGLAGRL